MTTKQQQEIDKAVRLQIARTLALTHKPTHTAGVRNRKPNEIHIGLTPRQSAEINNL